MTKLNTNPEVPARHIAPPKLGKKIQDRVDYICKCLQRESWGDQFEADIRDPGGEYVVAIVMLRANRNEALRDAIIKAFDCKTWEEVPWHMQAEQFKGMGAFQISRLATVARLNSAKKISLVGIPG